MGRANLSLLGQTTIYSWGASAGLTEAQTTLAVGLIAALLVVAVVYWFFGTEIGLALRATGYNPQMSRAQGVNTDSMVILGPFTGRICFYFMERQQEGEGGCGGHAPYSRRFKTDGCCGARDF